MAARNFLKPRLSSPDDCFSSNMDSPGCGDTDDASSENDSVGTCTQVQKVRSKQLPVPASVREQKVMILFFQIMSLVSYTLVFIFEINVE